MHKGFLKTGIALTALAVMLGAFGAHGLRPLLSEKELITYETAVRYQFYHSFAIIIVGIVFREFRSRFVEWAGWAFAAGLLIFSGSLYLLTTMRLLHKEGFEWLGAITPLGGILFVLGWIFLFAGISRKHQRSSL
ncbi:MAG: DUF423 domain-containing protein [Bacteroidota bacterium]|nr:DUF423 domain-containing protein [Ferruginibacter sp.]